MQRFVAGMDLADIATPMHGRAAENDAGASITLADGKVFRISNKQAADAASAAFPDRSTSLTFGGPTPLGSPIFPPGLLSIGAGPNSDSQNSESPAQPPYQDQIAKPDKDKLNSMHSFFGQQGLPHHAPEQPAKPAAPEQLAKTEATAGTAEHIHDLVQPSYPY